MGTSTGTVRRGTYVVQLVLLAGAYFGAAKLALLLAIPPGYATAVWPPSGIALAALLRMGSGVWPGVLLGAAATNFTIGGSLFTSIAIGAGNTLEALAAAALLTRGRDVYPFRSGEAVARFIGVAALASTIAATVGALSVAAGGELAPSAIAVNWLTWWQGDFAGIVIVAPLLLGWIVPPTHERWTRERALEAAVLGAATVVSTLVIFGESLGQPPLALAFLVVPFVLWAAFRFGQRDVSTLVAIICAIAVYCTLQRSGPTGSDSANASLIFLLLFNSTLVMIGLVVNATAAERARAKQQLERANSELEARIGERTRELEQANEALRAELGRRAERDETLRQSEERFRLLVDGMRDYAVFMLDPEGRVISWNAGAQRIKGYRADEIVGRHFSCFYTSEDLARDWPQHELAAARTAGRFEDDGWRVRKDGSRFWAHIAITALFDSSHRLIGYAKVTRDMTLRRDFEALQQTEREVNVFLAMLAHELRNPLAPIVNAVSVLSNDAAGADKLAEARAIIRRQVDHLARIVEDLLDISRVTRGKIALRQEPLDLNAAATRAIEAARPLIDARRHRLDVRLAERALPVEGDLTRLVQVLLNLLNNAAKYTDEGGVIEVSSAADGDRAIVRVRDNGVGINAELLPHVFELFVQGNRSLDRAEGGLGVGLTLVRRLVELHGGSVRVASAGAGRGSEFVVELPMIDASRLASAHPVSAEERAAPAARRVLIVDDNRDFADSMVTLLQLSGHEAKAVYHGAAALTAAREFRPHVVLLDIGLPGVNGYEVARALRSATELAPLTLIALTGYGRDEDRDRVVAAGFDHHLVKPVDPAELLAKIGSDAPSK